MSTITVWPVTVYNPTAVQRADRAAWEFHRRRGRRSREARVTIAKAGRQPGAPKPPYGYFIARKSDVIGGRIAQPQLGKYFVKQDEARTVRFVFEEFLRTGNCTVIAKMLTDLGIATSAGLRSWQPGVVWQMLQNRAYVGKAEYGREHTGSGRGLRGTGVEIPCPAIIETELFEAVQACLQEEIGTRLLKRAPSRQISVLHTLIRCGDCGKEMVCGRYKPSRELNRQGGEYYACKTCVPTWNGDTPRPQWSTYHGGTVVSMVQSEIAALLPEADRDLICGYLFSPVWDVPIWQRRNLLLLGRTRILLYNRPFRVEVKLGGPSASAEVSAYMARFMVKAGRAAIDQHNRDAMMRTHPSLAG